MSAALPRDWDLRRMPWLGLVDEDGRTLHLKVICMRPPSGPATIVTSEDGRDGPSIELPSIGDAERVLSLIEALAGRKWLTAHMGKRD